MRLPNLRALFATLLLACVVGGCEKHQDPIGTVPSDDVPAIPEPAPGTAPGESDVHCQGMSEPELDDCKRQRVPPPRQPAPVEPTHTPPPEA